MHQLQGNSSIYSPGAGGRGAVGAFDDDDPTVQIALTSFSGLQSSNLDDDLENNMDISPPRFVQKSCPAISMNEGNVEKSYHSLLPTKDTPLSWSIFSKITSGSIRLLLL